MKFIFYFFYLTTCLWAQDQNLLFPFYRSEFFSPEINGNLTLNVQYELPPDTYFNLINPPSGAFYPTELYNLQILGFPENYSQYDSLMSPHTYWVSGSEIVGNSISTPTSKYKYRRQFIKPTTVTAKIPMEIPEVQTEAQVKIDCKNNKNCPEQQINTDLKLEAVKRKILDEKLVPQKAFNNAWDYFIKNRKKFKNQNYMTVIDYNLPDDVPRLFLINLKTGTVESHKVAHGKESSIIKGNKKFAVKYSDTDGSNQSSYGAYLTDFTYNGEYGNSLKLHGLEKSNASALKRLIVVHGWEFKRFSHKPDGEPYLDPKGPYTQDTRGCFGIPKKITDTIYKKIKNGSLWYVEPFSEN